MNKLLISGVVVSLVSVAALAGFILLQPQGDRASRFDAKQEQAIESIVRSYLIENPEIMEEVFAELDKKRESEAAIARRPYLEELYKPASKYDRFSMGDGEIVLVEFMDYNCSACRNAYSILSEFADQENVEVRFVELPILGPMSIVAAQAAIAAEKQGKYTEFHDALMRYSDRLDSREQIMGFAEEVGLDLEQLKTDMDAPETQAIVEENLQLANSLGVRGTPAFFVGDTAIPGVPPDLREQLETAIAEAQENCISC